MQGAIGYRVIYVISVQGAIGYYAFYNTFVQGAIGYRVICVIFDTFNNEAIGCQQKHDALNI